MTPSCKWPVMWISVDAFIAHSLTAQLFDGFRCSRRHVVSLRSKRERCTWRSWKGVTTCPTPLLISFLLRLAHTLSCPPLAPPDLKELETTAKQATISRALEMDSLCTDVPPPSEKIGRGDFFWGRGDACTQARNVKSPKVALYETISNKDF